MMAGETPLSRAGSPSSAKCSSSVRPARRCTAQSGEEAARAGLSALVAVGGANARALADGARRAPACRPRSVHYVASSSEAADLAATLVKPGDLVLVKGSRGIRTEVVVDRLKAEFA